MTIIQSKGAHPEERQRAGGELRQALSRCRHALIGIALMSGMINVLYLTGSFFMLEIYDRVLPSRSVPTLVGLGGDRFRSVRLSRACSTCMRGRVLVAHRRFTR